jgi:hypothetical protein
MNKPNLYKHIGLCLVFLTFIGAFTYFDNETCTEVFKVIGIFTSAKWIGDWARAWWPLWPLTVDKTAK